MLRTLSLILALFLTLPGGLWAQRSKGDMSRTDNSKFRQIDEMLPTPNVYRAGSGAPGHKYWQQQADYDMSLQLDDENQRLSGAETITYYNRSPDPLDYLWVQLDQNVRAKDSDTYKTGTRTLDDDMSFSALRYLQTEAFDGGYKIGAVTDDAGRPLPYTINRTMMRVDLPRTLKPGGTYKFEITWSYNIQNQRTDGGRSGYEYFAEDDNYLYEMAQFYPRMAVYDDVNGWQHKQFLGRGEFALPFGDYRVSITAPADHVVASTGTLQNASQVLTATQRQRLKRAESAETPVLIITPDEALAAEGKRAGGTKTWVFHADNVRDFAWASSRKFIWDALNVPVGGKDVMAMSYYPKEGNPLWEQYSTESIAHTLRVYSRMTIDYPYPVAISVNGPVGGMEYPMICFNGPRPEADGTYTARIKYGLISVIIHEVGHNYFPMIINSDERQWTWMDEGLNSFVQFIAEQEWERDYPSRRGEPYKIVPYMSAEKDLQVPIMTNSESILQFGNNAYGKPATALNILRETVLGRELFDHAFKVYSERWAFKHPMPADFFRSMEDASGTDLDWFWNGWFYTTDHVDISLDDVKYFQINTRDPDQENPLARAERDEQPLTISRQRYREEVPEPLIERKPQLKDFYNRFDPLSVAEVDREDYRRYYDQLGEDDRALLASGLHFYQLDFTNVGGLVMPIIVKAEFEDGSDTLVRIPAEIWRLNNYEVNKVLHFDRPVASFVVDPYLETADTDVSNNAFPRQAAPTRFRLYQYQRQRGQNPMQRYGPEAGRPDARPTQPGNQGR
ncbi:MAG: M1 family metallopeptidase [Catalinimonas sp.]